MALHAPLTQFLARLNTDLGAGTGVEFLAATGRRLVATHVLPEEEFSRQGQPNDSDLGSLLRTLHSLGPAVNWAEPRLIQMGRVGLYHGTVAESGG